MPRTAPGSPALIWSPLADGSPPQFLLFLDWGELSHEAEHLSSEPLHRPPSAAAAPTVRMKPSPARDKFRPLASNAQCSFSPLRLEIRPAPPACPCRQATGCWRRRYESVSQH